MKTLEAIFEAASTTRYLEYFSVYLAPILKETPSEDQVASLKNSFTKFLKHQAARLYYLYVEVNFEESEKDCGIAPFTYLPEFIKSN